MARLDLFTSRGDPLGVPLNSATRSTLYDLGVRAGGVPLTVPQTEAEGRDNTKAN